MTRWTYLVADLKTNQVLGELPLTGVRIGKVLNGAGQMAWDLQLSQSLVAKVDVFDLTRPVRRVLYALLDGTPYWGGIIWASSYDSAQQKISGGAADWWSYFDHRKVLEVLTAGPWAPSYIAGLSKVYTQQDQNDIARGLVQLAESHTGGDIGIVYDATTTGTLRDRTYDGFELTYTGEALRNLTDVIDGPDVRFDVGAYDQATGTIPRLMLTGGPFLGQMGQPHTWDLGANLLSYSWDVGGGVMATRAFAQGEGQDRGTLIAVAEDTTRYADGWPLLETDDTFSGVTETATLQDHADTLLDTLSVPLTTLKLTARGDMAPTVTEVAPGDTGTVYIPKGDLFFQAGLTVQIRVLTVEAGIEDSGTVTIEMTTAVTGVM